MSKQNPKTDYHKPRKMVAVRKRFHAPTDHLIETEQFENLTDIVNAALEFYLTHLKLLPWQAKRKKDD